MRLRKRVVVVRTYNDDKLGCLKLEVQHFFFRPKKKGGLGHVLEVVSGHSDVCE